MLIWGLIMLGTACCILCLAMLGYGIACEKRDRRGK